jgi:hypothetical protein
MNWITILGIIFIAIGTFLTRYGIAIAIIGVIIFALGTYLTYYGTTIVNKKDKEEIKKDILSFSKKIDDLNKGAKSEEIKKEAIKLETEFKLWADDFLKNKPRKKIELEKSEIDFKIKNIELNEKYKAIYEFFYKCLKNFIDAYNENLNKKIFYEIPEQFPQNVFITGEKYIAKIQFEEKLFWKFELRTTKSIGTEDRYPIIYIIIDNKLEDISLPLPEITIHIKLDKNQIYLLKYGDLLRIPALKDEYELDNYEKSIKNIIKELMEYQLIKLEN